MTILAAPLLISACSAANDVADAVTRDRAKTVVNAVVERRFPRVNAAPVTDCVIDAASAGEILTIARDSVGGVQPATVDLVVDIASRPESVQCIAENGLTLLAG
ncbi:succinate dehydrogenase [Roseovarius aestuariivivens]|uniref:succinate dehydrogenase n=1 Tax=Roseovarius aestuariivivens TaxID=1888910 RepID=UPI0010809FDE|nr:succinate dehydrogenase [Roseovarius aestuariivivens]